MRGMISYLTWIYNYICNNLFLSYSNFTRFLANQIAVMEGSHAGDPHSAPSQSRHDAAAAQSSSDKTSGQRICFISKLGDELARPVSFEVRTVQVAVGHFKEDADNQSLLTYKLKVNDLHFKPITLSILLWPIFCLDCRILSVFSQAIWRYWTRPVVRFIWRGFNYRGLRHLSYSRLGYKRIVCQLFAKGECECFC